MMTAFSFQESGMNGIISRMRLVEASCRDINIAPLCYLTALEMWPIVLLQLVPQCIHIHIVSVPLT
jgi:hypothetical protein